jgi:type I restriction enzyme, S subunit
MLDKARNAGRPYQYLRNTNVHWFDVRTHDLKTVPLEEADAAKYLLQQGDILICEGGHGIGRTAVWRSERADVAFQKALHRVWPGPELVSDFFAYCVFVYERAGVLANYFTGVGIPHFTGSSDLSVVAAADLGRVGA